MTKRIRTALKVEKNAEKKQMKLIRDAGDKTVSGMRTKKCQDKEVH